MKHKLQIGLLFAFISITLFGQNVFLDRKFWATKPSIEIIKQKINEGNQLLEMGPGSWDGPMMAIQADCDLEVIQFILDQPNFNPNVILHHANNYIMWTALKGNLPVMEMLLKKGSKTDIINSHGQSLIMHVAMSGTTNPELYEFCLKNGAKITDKDDLGRNLMLMAIPSLKDLKFLDYFVKKGIQINSTDNNGNGLFHYSIASGNMNTIKELVAMKISTEKNKLGENAFAFIGKGRGAKLNFEVLNYLKSLGLDAKNTFENGQNLAHTFARLGTDEQGRKFLTENKIQLNLTDKEGTTPLMIAAANSDENTLDYWLKTNSINAQNKKGKTALHNAIAYNTPEIVAFLISKGAKTKVLDAEGKDVYFQLISSFRNGKNAPVERTKTIMNILDKSGVKMKHNGELLHTAFEKGDTNLINLMLESGENINAKDKDGYTILHYAALKSKNLDMLKFLIEKGADSKIKTELNESIIDLVNENEALKTQTNTLDFLK